MSDIQVITLSCLAESLSIDSENWLFGKLRSGYPKLFTSLIHRTTYNRRRRRLSEKTAQLSKLVCLKFSGQDSEYVIDSIPVPICRKPRIARLKYAGAMSWSYLLPPGMRAIKAITMDLRCTW